MGKELRGWWDMLETAVIFKGRKTGCSRSTWPEFGVRPASGHWEWWNEIDRAPATHTCASFLLIQPFGHYWHTVIYMG